MQKIGRDCIFAKLRFMVRKEEQEMCRECIKKVLEWYSFGVIVGVGFYIGLTFAVQVLKVVTDVMRQWCL